MGPGWFYDLWNIFTDIVGLLLFKKSKRKSEDQKVKLNSQMLPYEESLGELFPKIGKLLKSNDNDQKGPIEIAKRNAIFFMQTKCSCVFGFTGEIRRVKTDQTLVSALPSIYDNCLILDVLKDVKDELPCVIETLTNILRNNEKPSGVFNFFLKHQGKCENLFPDDADDTSLCQIALNSISPNKEKFFGVAVNLLEKLMFDTEGEMSAWLRMDDKDNESILYKSLLKSPRVDLGTIINTLWFLGLNNLDCNKKVRPSFNLLGRFLQELKCEGKTNHVITHRRYYTNKYFLLFLTSRYVSASIYAKNEFGITLAHLIRSNIFNLNLNSENKPKALDIAAMILASINLKMHIHGLDEWNESELQVCQLQDRIQYLVKFMCKLQNKNGSFDAQSVYHWYKQGEYGGSKAISTALALAALSKCQREDLSGGRKNYQSKMD